MLTDLEELGWVGSAGQGVIEVVGGVILAPLGRVREGLVGILDLLEMLLDLLLLALISHCCSCLVWVVLKRSLPVGCSTYTHSAEFSGEKRQKLHGRFTQPDVTHVKDKGNLLSTPMALWEKLSSDLYAAMLTSMQPDACNDISCIAVCESWTGATFTKLLHRHHTQTVYITAAVSALQCSLHESLGEDVDGAVSRCRFVL